MDYAKFKGRSLGNDMDLKICEQAKKVRGAALRAEELVALQSLSILHSTMSEFEISVSEKEMLRVRLTASEKECDGLTMEVRSISLKAPEKLPRGLREQGDKENRNRPEARSILKGSSPRIPLIPLPAKGRKKRMRSKESAQPTIPVNKLVGASRAGNLQLKSTEYTLRPGRTTIRVVKQQK